LIWPKTASFSNSALGRRIFFNQPSRRAISSGNSSPRKLLPVNRRVLESRIHPLRDFCFLRSYLHTEIVALDLCCERPAQGTRNEA
jgi:hypothetical protein